MRRKRTKRILLITALSVALAFILSAALIVISGLSDDIHAADVAIVPGNKVENDGRPSERLRARLDKVIALYGQGLFPDVIVSGGTGSEGFDEAEVMKRYLVENGLPETHVYVDSGGRRPT
jgi:vancomycin permeability regulator SanA